MDYNDLTSGDVAHLVNLIREGKPDIEGSKALLSLFCKRGKKLKFPASPFPEPLLELLVSVFEKYLSGEAKDLEKSLGLKRRGKPPNPAIEKRNIFIALDVLRLHFTGKPLVDNRIEQGAFSIIGEANELSDNEIRDIYYKHYIDAKSIELLGRLSEND